MRKIDEAYEFIKNYIIEKDYPPTIREIGDAIGVSSTSTVAYYLRKLEENNKIVKGSYKNRSIQLMENIVTRLDSADIISLPCIRSITPNQPLMSEHNIYKKLMCSGSMFKGIDMFALLAKDNNMFPSGIMKDDLVVVSRQNVARNGEVVAAMVGTNYMIGRLYREFNMFKLQPDNKQVDPIYADKIMILGKIVGVIRNQIN